ncbi:hypothetical protein ABIE50_003046 [Chitinophaga sp. OAE865]
MFHTNTIIMCRNANTIWYPADSTRDMQTTCKTRRSSLPKTTFLFYSNPSNIFPAATPNASCAVLSASFVNITIPVFRSGYTTQ